MKHCVIALHFQDHYISVVCHYDTMNVGEILNEHYRSIDQAEEIVSKGDISHFEGTEPCHFFEGDDYSWRQAKPFVHESPKALIEYSLSVDATHILSFEKEKWQEIPITRESGPSNSTSKVS